METDLQEIRDQFVGKWKVDRDENFEAFLRETGMGYVFRKLVRYIKPTSDIMVDGDSITITLNAGFIQKRDTFKLNEEFDSNLQGIRSRVTATYKDGQLILDMLPYKASGKPMQHIREIVNGELTMCIGDVRCKRYLKRLQ